MSGKLPQGTRTDPQDLTIDSPIEQGATHYGGHDGHGVLAARRLLPGTVEGISVVGEVLDREECGVARCMKMVIMMAECNWLAAGIRCSTRGVETLKLLGFFYRYPRAAGNACPNWCPLFTIYKQTITLVTCSHLSPLRSYPPHPPHIPHIVYTAPELSSLSQHSQI